MPDLIGAAPGDYILVAGNHLAHKDVLPTVGAIASAFPFERIEVLGPSPVRSPRVRTHASGNLADRDVHTLYASAKLVVFHPSMRGSASGCDRAGLRPDHAGARVLAPARSGGAVPGPRPLDRVPAARRSHRCDWAVAARPSGARDSGRRCAQRPSTALVAAGRGGDRPVPAGLMSTVSTASWHARTGFVSQALAYRA